MSAKRLGNAAKTYLSAIGASAIYVSVDQGKPVSVGVARDLDKALRNLRKAISPTLSFGWVAWSPRYQVLVDIAQAPFVALTLDETVTVIETLAKARGIALTPHKRALERARVYARFLDDTLAVLQEAGEFAAFNRAYKAHRQERLRRRESVKPYWAVMSELRGVVIRALVTNKKTRMLPSSALAEIRKHFPWFSRTHRNGRRKRQQATR